MAAVLSRLLGRTITYTEVSFAANREAMIRGGVPAPIAEMNALAHPAPARWGSSARLNVHESPAQVRGSYPGAERE
jgi:hypothetical protein